MALESLGSLAPFLYAEKTVLNGLLEGLFQHFLRGVWHAFCLIAATDRGCDFVSSRAMPGRLIFVIDRFWCEADILAFS
jgi:hypothetical protein